ncbi:MAG: hypothetical protein AB8G77_27540 [Rhodothermales bacterium]
MTDGSGIDTLTASITHAVDADMILGGESGNDELLVMSGQDNVLSGDYGSDDLSSSKRQRFS